MLPLGNRALCAGALAMAVLPLDAVVALADHGKEPPPVRGDWGRGRR